MNDTTPNWLKQEYVLITKKQAHKNLEQIKKLLKNRKKSSLAGISHNKIFSKMRIEATAFLANIKHVNKYTDTTTAVDNDLRPFKVMNIFAHKELNRREGPVITINEKITEIDFNSVSLALGLWTKEGEQICTVKFQPSKKLDAIIKASFNKTSNQFEWTSTKDDKSKKRVMGSVDIVGLLLDKEIPYKVYADNFDDMSRYLKVVPGFKKKFDLLADRFLDDFIGIKNVGILKL